ncbi:50S ribosomal protein L23 [Candidatus Nasuia deltocephalinicola]|nr:50S ribosomal protein L23 [Candidatus Nasuia deltocephalinicola]
MINIIKYNFYNNFYLIKILKNFWSNKFYKQGVLILEVFLFYNKNFIKKSVEFIFNIKVIKINTLIQKYYFYKNKKLINIIRKKKVFIKF